MKRKLLIAAMVLGTIFAPVSCTPRYLTRTLVAAAIVGSAVAVAGHDDHQHDAYCGHHRRWHDGHWVYYYQGHWEFSDGSRWYAYP